jgi:hypothetical protein
MTDLALRLMALEVQYDKTFRMIENILPSTRGVDVGVEIDGQQILHVDALKNRMIKRRVYFSFAQQKMAPDSQVGIRSRLEGGNKHWRLRMMLPMWQNKKIWFPEHLRNTPDMDELLEEIRYTTSEAIGSKYDDGLDILSQLQMIDIRYPVIQETKKDRMRRMRKLLKSRKGPWEYHGEYDEDASSLYDRY